MKIKLSSMASTMLCLSLASLGTGVWADTPTSTEKLPAPNARSGKWVPDLGAREAINEIDESRITEMALGGFFFGVDQFNPNLSIKEPWLIRLFLDACQSVGGLPRDTKLPILQGPSISTFPDAFNIFEGTDLASFIGWSGSVLGNSRINGTISDMGLWRQRFWNWVNVGDSYVNSGINYADKYPFYDGNFLTQEIVPRLKVRNGYSYLP